MVYVASTKVANKQISFGGAMNVVAYASIPVVAVSILNMVFGLIWYALPVIFLLVAICTRYISLASCLACLAGPIFMVVFGHGGLEVLLTLFCTLVVVVRHAENIVRIIGGTENRFSFSRNGQK